MGHDVCETIGTSVTVNADYVMLCSNVCECWTGGHDVCNTVDASVTVNAGFVDGPMESSILFW